MAQPHSLTLEEMRRGPWYGPALGLAVAFLWFAVGGGQIALHNDDAMRLVQVRDLLAGQGWFDLSQARLGLAEGTPMHWSRLVDAPLAGFILLTRSLVGQGGAEIMAMVLWPALVFGLTVVALGAICRKFGGAKAELIGTILAAVMLARSGKFDPGSFDHHNIQILLLVAGLAGFVRRRDDGRYAVIAGVALALSVGIGVETLPLIAALCGAFGISWAMQGEAGRRQTVGFGLSLGMTLMVVFFTMSPVEAWIGGFCDALSRDLFVPVLCGGAGLAGLAAVSSQASRTVRFVALGALALVVLSVTMKVGPSCLGNPYAALDPLLQEKWLARVAEATPLAGASAAWQGFFVGGVVGLLVAVSFARRGPERSGWLALSAVLALALAMSVLQIRGLTVVAALGIIPTAVLAASLIGQQARRGSLVALTAVFLSVPAVPAAMAELQLSPVKTVAATPRGPRIAKPATGVPCTAEQDLAALATLPPGTVATPPYFGAHILLHTPHRVLAAPYHRNQAGLLAQLDLAYAPREETHALLKKYGVDYVIHCAGDRQFARENPGLASHLKPEAIADFLEPLPGSGPLALYRVR